MDTSLFLPYIGRDAAAGWLCAWTAGALFVDPERIAEPRLRKHLPQRTFPCGLRRREYCRKNGAWA